MNKCPHGNESLNAFTLRLTVLAPRFSVGLTPGLTVWPRGANFSRGNLNKRIHMETEERLTKGQKRAAWAILLYAVLSVAFTIPLLRWRIIVIWPPGGAPLPIIIPA